MNGEKIDLSHFYMTLLYHNSLKIEEIYLKLYELDVDGEDMDTYNDYLKELEDYSEKERRILVNIKGIDLSYYFKIYGNELDNNNRYLFIGKDKEITISRMQNIVEGILEGNPEDLDVTEDYLSYVVAVKRDMAFIMYRMLEYLINVEALSSIKNDLIKYKYSLMYSNRELEAAFLSGELEENIYLESRGFSTDIMPVIKYINKGLLDIECFDLIDDIFNSMDLISKDNDDNDNNDNDQEYLKCLLYIMDLFTRLFVGGEPTQKNLSLSVELSYNDIQSVESLEELYLIVLEAIRKVEREINRGNGLCR